jgi:hypothetical protein
MDIPVTPTALNPVDLVRLSGICQQAAQRRRNFTADTRDASLGLSVDRGGRVVVQLGSARFDEYNLWLVACMSLAAPDTVSGTPDSMDHYARISFVPKS